MNQPTKKVAIGGKIMKSLIKMFGVVICSAIISSDLHADIGVVESTSLLTIKGGTGSYFSTVGEAAIQDGLEPTSASLIWHNLAIP
jgi:hypothetical protein